MTSGLAANATCVGVPQSGQNAWSFSFPLTATTDQILVSPLIFTASGSSNTR